MRGRKKAPTPDGNTDSDSDAQTAPSMPAGLNLIVGNIDKIRTRRTKVRTAIEGDFTKGVSDLKARINKHYETEEAKRSKIREKQLERFANAIEKKAACEDAILKMILSLSEECTNLAALMDSVYTGRQNAVNNAVTAQSQEKKR